ncbi:MAG: HAMP domain-containing protein [Elusimicrobia bacterium]|nr:HAMP domain-containing protein [Candidatus Obscuribacterium magneticum]
MSIRRRLFSFITFMTGLLFLIGILSLYGGQTIVSAFRKSIGAMDTLNALRELKSHSLQQKASLQYMLVGDDKELLKFEEASGQAKETLDTYKKRVKGKPPAWHEELTDLFENYDAVARKVASLYEKGQVAKAYDETTANLIPRFQKFSDRVNALENEHSNQARHLFDTSQVMSDRAGFIVFIVIMVAILLGTFLFRTLYNAVMKPLAVLKKGAEEFGGGHWDYRIQLSLGNEFGELARSFNAMAENVKQLQLQAVHMDRMSAVGQLAGGVAHEINNPLTGVLGQAQILLSKLQETDPPYASLKKIEQAALRCKKIVRGLLDFSRPGQALFEDINVNDLFLATLDLCEADMKGSKVNVEKKFSKNLPRIQGNPSELQQVFLNLINNALHAMMQGGTLTLETRTHNRSMTVYDRRQSIPPRVVGGPWVEVMVKDTGVGIARDHLPRIFEPFFTTKEIGKGTGLGLSVSMGIVKKHGGVLTVESVGLNQGASFFISLPIKGAMGTAAYVEQVPKMAA